MVCSSGCAGKATATPTTAPPATALPPTSVPTAIPTATAAPTTRIVTDMSGRQVEIPVPDRIQRIAVLTSPQVLNVYVLGMQDKLCAVTNAIKSWPRLARMDPRLESVPGVRGSFAQVNVEALLQTNPDFCLGSVGDMEAVASHSDLPTLQVATNPPGEYFQHQKKEMLFFGQVLGREERAQKYADYLDNLLQDIQRRGATLPAEKRIKVYVGFGTGHLITYGGDTYMNEWIQAAGCDNTAGGVSTSTGSEGGLGEMQLEQILSWDPDLIVLDEGQPKSLLNDPQWSNVKAVRNSQVFRLPVGLFIWNRPSPEASVMVPLWLAMKAYPNLFKDVSLHAEVKRAYSELFNMQFSDEEITTILNTGN
jgi:iron complex transport system substrate-binding protein